MGDIAGRLLREKKQGGGGELSASRAFMFFFSGVIFAVWVGVIGWTVWGNWGLSGEDLSNYWQATGVGDAMQWALVAFFGTIVPYIVNQGAAAVKKDPGGGGV